MTNPRLWDDPALAWSPYEPGPSRPWDLGRVAHLHRRAGLGATYGQLQRDLKEGPGPSLDRLFKGEDVSLDDLEAPEFARRADALDQSADAPEALAAAWLHRLIHTPAPLRERVALFWHDHFATSIDKVLDVALMRAQVAKFRAMGLGPFGPLLSAIGKDPAMLVFLDSTSNRKLSPNENYAREVMELFALGRGHYSEKDIQEAARAFSGRHVMGGRYVELAAQHDDGVKTFLGRTGRFDGEDVVAALLGRPACADFLCVKLARWFVSDRDSDPIDAEFVRPLADLLRSNGHDVGPVVETIVRSRLFFSDEARRRRVKSPVELAVGTVRALGTVRPTVRLIELGRTCGALGQRLYAPPSVAGWDGGRAWVSTASLIGRANLASALAGPDAKGLGRPCDVKKWLETTGATDPKTAADRAIDLLVQDGLGPEGRKAVHAAAERAGSLESAARAALAAVASSPEHQLA